MSISCPTTTPGEAVAEQDGRFSQAERYKRLLADNFVSKDPYDQVRTQAESLEAAVKADQAAVENTKLQLQYCYMHAPISGRVGQFLLHVGNMVKNLETTLATIKRIRPVYVVFAVPEQQLPEIRSSAAARQLQVQAFLGADGAHASTGELSFIDNGGRHDRHRTIKGHLSQRG